MLNFIVIYLFFDQMLFLLPGIFNFKFKLLYKFCSFQTTFVINIRVQTFTCRQLLCQSADELGGIAFVLMEQEGIASLVGRSASAGIEQITSIFNMVAVDL